MSVAEDSFERTIEILCALEGKKKARIVLGITGAPGSGKSLLTGRLVSEFRARYPERMVGIIAVDPSSPFSGGAILGDRVRMMEHANDPKVFIRSLATHGQVGGVTEGTRAIVAIMGALGCDVVLVETVGVGQMEFAVRDVADAVAIILAPGQGDTIQFLKAGLMEIGDLFVVNKSDHPDAAQFHAQLVHSLYSHYSERRPVLQTSARDNTGIGNFVDVIEGMHAKNFEQWKALRQERLRGAIKKAVLFHAEKRLKSAFSELVVSEVLSGRSSVSKAADELIYSIP